MTDAFDLSSEEQRENIQEFMEVHGAEGFFTLYFRQLFYRYVKQELKSATDSIDDVSQQLYFAEEGDELLQKYRQEMIEQSEVRARELVEDLKEDPDIGPIFESGDLDTFEQSEHEFIEIVHQRFESWKDDGIDLLEEIEETSSEEDPA